MAELCPTENYLNHHFLTLPRMILNLHNSRCMERSQFITHNWWFIACIGEWSSKVMENMYYEKTMYGFQFCTKINSYYNSILFIKNDKFMERWKDKEKEVYISKDSKLWKRNYKVFGGEMEDNGYFFLWTCEKQWKREPLPPHIHTIPPPPPPPEPSHAAICFSSISGSWAWEHVPGKFLGCQTRIQTAIRYMGSTSLCTVLNCCCIQGGPKVILIGLFV